MNLFRGHTKYDLRRLLSSLAGTRLNSPRTCIDVPGKSKGLRNEYSHHRVHGKKSRGHCIHCSRCRTWCDERCWSSERFGFTAGADVVLLGRSVPELSKILLAKRMKQLKPEIPMIVVIVPDAERKAFPEGCIFASEDRKGLLKRLRELQPKAC